ncbi:undecaprenyl-phosphate glucose phosphotransferase [Thiorhodovibrio litoralis]|uniref:undecaprenyl-phosphate glucose phosphotransferase n=1 Tax=Thiorhodovibrio litoralis TaxID=2952932 RepID=UPI002B25E2D8|nr:undecaprenyl-phosphate glucose phosphotransferase [Thiorhodovibrio litoralis]WPL11519.1 UDP-glucose:undecaprenyl-phosphate glucose-1-phosphate transferase [Thiorhodovibrio litoralis]
MESSETAATATLIPLERSAAKSSFIKRPNYQMFAADFVALPLTALLCYLVLYLVHFEEVFEGHIYYAGAVALAMVAFGFYGFTAGLYDWRQHHETIKRPFTSFGMLLWTFATLLAVGFILKVSSNFSRLWVGSWFAAFAAYLLVSRVFLVWYLSRLPYEAIRHRNAIILGAGEQGHKVLEHIKRFKGHGLHVVGFVDDRGSRLPENPTDLPIIGCTKCIDVLVKEYGVDLVIIAMPWSAYARIKELLEKLANWAVDIFMAPDHLGLLYADRPVYRIGGMHVLSLKDRPISEWSALVKRIEDLAVAIPAVILLSPLLALTALAIKLESKGPVLFVQERFGFHNELIRVYKFRSMYTDRTDSNAETLATRNDPRVTRVGRFIRCTSIDELPQIFNVINGTMSIVGPRPHATLAKAGDRLYQEAVDIYASRHRVKPGITGWAQCNGWRGETDTEKKIVKRVEHDLYYIDNWSIFLDIMIIIKTFGQVFWKDKNAY